MTSVLSALVCLLGVARSAYCSGKPDPNAPTNDFGYADASPQLIGTVDNGKAFLVGPAEQQFYLLHLYGTPYEQGYAQGELLKDVIVEFMAEVWEYIISEMPLSTVLPGLDNATLKEALAITADATSAWTSTRIYQEIQGMSDATGIPYDDILQIHMLPSLTQGHCSMFGAWGNATLKSQNGDLLQLRALDWDTDGPFKDYPMVSVYHPKEESDGHAFANIAFTGFVGSITGISSARCSISEIGVSYPDETFGRESRFGAPFPFVLRDVLQFDKTVEDATQRMNTTRRTCDLILGVGCGDEGEHGVFRGYEYSYSTLEVYDWHNLEPYDESADPQWHPRIEDVVYWGMDWLCPNYDIVLSEQLNRFYGEIDAEVAIKNIVAQTQTGNLHIAVYDYHQDAVFISFAARSDQDVQLRYAYSRPYVKFDLKSLFDEAL